MKWIWFLILVCGALECQEDLSHVSLDAYLNQHGFFLTPSRADEGYSTLKQRMEFIADLQKLGHVKKILEIGFNAGHSAEAFLTHTGCEKLVSFDINTHRYTATGVQFMKDKFKERFEFVPGDSKKQIPKYAASHQKEKFDLIFIDGCHSLECVVNDIRNCAQLAHRDTLIWLDDYETILAVKVGVNDCIDKGIITLLDAKSVDDEMGKRSWAIAQYTTPSERVFSNIYKKGLWGRDKRGVAISGPGSTVEAGGPFIEYVQDILDNNLKIQSILDVGCGDWVLARKINWGERDYLGIDVVRSLVLKNQMQFGTDQIRFAYVDALVDSLPSADLVICKDLFSGLPNDKVLALLEKLKEFKYSLFVDDIQAPYYASSNGDIFLGDFRPLDLTMAPFLLKAKKVAYYRSGMTMKQMLFFENE